MASISDDRQLVPTILDRLIDANPSQARNSAPSRGFVLSEMKRSVRRDLENLLNTRFRATPVPAHLEELGVSLVNYGIPDFTGASFANEEDRKELRRIVEKAIRRFEPRFKEVTVYLDSKPTSNDRVIRFRIDALLHADPAPEPVVFDSQLEPSSNLFKVNGEE